MKLDSNNYQRVAAFLGSRKFFVFTLVLLVFQAAWIALSARYPQAFDEQFHFGIIQIYASHWSPFLSSQPPSSGQYGPLTVDNSYLYHYLMSFPFRLIAHFTSSQMTQIVVLRFINIGLFASGLVVFRKVLRLLPLGPAYINLAMLIFVALPVVPLLAAQINYDNLIFLLSGLAVLLTARLAAGLREKKIIRLDELAMLLVICLLGSLVQFKFLGVVAGVVVALTWSLAGARLPLAVLTRRTRQLISPLKLAICTLVVLTSLGLFLQRYGVDVVRYHKITPDCVPVLSEKECSLQGPYQRSQYNHSHNPPLSNFAKLTYIGPWFKHNITELTFTISSSYDRGGIMVDYFSKNPLPVMLGLVWALSLSGLALIIRFWARLWRQPAARTFLIISGVYVLILLAKNYQAYLYERDVVAVHGRYLFPVLLLLISLGLLGLKWLLDSPRLAKYARPAKIWLVVICIVALTQGGGLITWLARSDSSWFWPSSSSTRHVNQTARDVLHRIVIGS